MNRSRPLCVEVLESRDVPSATPTAPVAAAPVETGYGGTHVLYQDVVIPAAASNQGWGKWEVNPDRVLNKG